MIYSKPAKRFTQVIENGKGTNPCQYILCNRVSDRNDKEDEFVYDVNEELLYLEVNSQ